MSPSSFDPLSAQAAAEISESPVDEILSSLRRPTEKLRELRHTMALQFEYHGAPSIRYQVLQAFGHELTEASTGRQSLGAWLERWRIEWQVVIKGYLMATTTGSDLVDDDAIRCPP